MRAGSPGWHREPADAPLWAAYGQYVIVGGGLILAQACLIAVLLLQRTGRRRAEQSLTERLRFERLLSELSARLVPVSLDAVDIEIERGLRRVAEFLGVGRASLHEYVPGGAIARICWAVEGVEGQSSILEADRFPWTAGQLVRGQVVRVSRLDELPAEAAIDRQSHQDSGTRSCLSLPLSAGGSMLGALSFDSIDGERDWPVEFVQRLELLSEVFAGALERKRTELSIAERLRFETLLSEQTATFSSLSTAEIDRGIERALRRIVDFFKADWGSLAEFSHDSQWPGSRTHGWPRARRRHR